MRARLRMLVATLVCFATLGTATRTAARSAGIDSSQFAPLAAGCNTCHSGGTTPSVALSGPTTIAIGSTQEMTLGISGGSAGFVGGLNVSANIGSATASLSTGGTGSGLTRTVTNPATGRIEITHSAPSTLLAGSHNYTFNMTASNTAACNSVVNLTGWGLAANNSGGNNGDRGASDTLSVTLTCPPGQLRMSECVAEISELVSTVQISVERVGGSSGAIGVSYATAAGGALAGSDYTDTSGVLSWGDGDVSLRSISIPILNSAALENREDFDVNLSAPTGGASLAIPSGTRIWILDGQDHIFADSFGDLPPCNY